MSVPLTRPCHKRNHWLTYSHRLQAQSLGVALLLAVPGSRTYSNAAGAATTHRVGHSDRALNSAKDIETSLQRARTHSIGSTINSMPQSGTRRDRLPTSGHAGIDTRWLVANDTIQAISDVRENSARPVEVSSRGGFSRYVTSQEQAQGIVWSP